MEKLSQKKKKIDITPHEKYQLHIVKSKNDFLEAEIEEGAHNSCGRATNES